ncbi:hypothetical protein [Cupriavidus basilensis]|uniref:hypothetical protein n=1 Tax=Cupriavidus basilensis TaxID=68895 RepID=UPI0039F69B60
MSTTAESPNAYGTTAELAFLKHLGGQLTRKVLLRNYIAAAEQPHGVGLDRQGPRAGLRHAPAGGNRKHRTTRGEGSMSARKGDNSAFPYSALVPDEQTRQLVGSMYLDSTGLTQRAYIATKAMQAIVSNPALVDVFSNGTTELVSRRAVEIADAMLAALEQQS